MALLWIAVVIFGMIRCSFEVLEANFILVADGHATQRKIHQLNSDGVIINTFGVEQSGNPTAVEYDPILQKIFWSGRGDLTLSSMDLDGLNKQLIFQLPDSSVEGISLDPTEELIFFTDRVGKTLNSVRYNGNGHQAILSDLTYPRGVAVDTHNKDIYWTDVSTGKIERCDYDGTNRVIVVHEANFEINDLTLDLSGGYVYYTASADVNSIYRTAINNPSDTIIVVDATRAPCCLHGHLYGISLCQNYLFTTDWDLKKVFRLNLESNDVSTFSEINSYQYLFGIHAYCTDSYGATTEQPTTELQQTTDHPTTEQPTTELQQSTDHPTTEHATTMSETTHSATTQHAATVSEATHSTFISVDDIPVTTTNTIDVVSSTKPKTSSQKSSKTKNIFQSPFFVPFVATLAVLVCIILIVIITLVCIRRQHSSTPSNMYAEPVNVERNDPVYEEIHVSKSTPEVNNKSHCEDIELENNELGKLNPALQSHDDVTCHASVVVENYCNTTNLSTNDYDVPQAMCDDVPKSSSANSKSQYGEIKLENNQLGDYIPPLQSHDDVTCNESGYAQYENDCNKTDLPTNDYEVPQSMDYEL